MAGICGTGFPGYFQALKITCEGRLRRVADPLSDPLIRGFQMCGAIDFFQ
jgi:hypothetical protein